MKSRTKLALLCVALTLAGCGVPQQQAGEEPDPSTTTSSVVATTSTTTGSMTSSAPESTTTVPEGTTTTVPEVDDEVASLAAALDADTPMRSGRIEASIEFEGLDDASDLSDGTLLFSTAFDTDSGDTAFLMDMSSMIEPSDFEGIDDGLFPGLTPESMSQMEVRQVGNRVYLRYPFFVALAGAETEWLSMPADEGQEFTTELETMPTDPNVVLSEFEQAGVTIDRVGEENVNDVATTHYSISLDTTQMDLGVNGPTAMDGLGMPVAGVIPVELWVSADGYVVRMIMEVDGTGIDAPATERFDTMTLRYDVFDINGDVVIEAPPASQVTPAEDLEDSTLGWGY